MSGGPGRIAYHQKTLTVDGATSVIMTLNLVARTIPATATSPSSTPARRRRRLAAIVAAFNADFAGRAITPPDGADLVWSPTNAKASVLSVIDGAKTPSPSKTRRWTTRLSPPPWMRARGGT